MLGQNSCFPNFDDDDVEQTGLSQVRKVLGDHNQRYSQNPARGYNSQAQIAFDVDVQTGDDFDKNLD